MAPEVRCASGRGLDVPAARETRVLLDDGRLLVRRPGRDEQVVPATDVTAAHWLDAARSSRLLGGRGGLRDAVLHPGGAVVLSGDAGPLVAWRVDDMTPGMGGEPWERRETSGSVALVRALGLTLEPAPADGVPDRGAVRRALVSPTRSPGPERVVALASAAAALVLGGFGLRGLEEPTTTWTLLTGAGVAAVVPVLVLTVLRTRDFLRVAAEPAGVRLGSDEIVITDGAAGEWWLPGPARGGVVGAVLGPEEIHLVDARHRVLAALVSADVLPDEATASTFVAACTAAGIAVTDPSALPPANHGAEAIGFRHPAVPGDLTPARRGDLDLVSSSLRWIALIVLVVAGLAATGSGPIGVLVLVAAVAALAVAIGCWYAGWQWRRALIRPAHPAGPTTLP